MSEQAVATPADQSANSGAFIKAFLPGLIIGLVLGGLAGAFFGGFAADSGGPAAAIERSKAEALRSAPSGVTPPPAPATAEPAKPEEKAPEAGSAPAKPEEKPH
ncbi:MAG: hypothetical protein JNM86_12755 [Phycisphaerae bacterium]|nr:hypothetical protein [Phycisphaerae bacterium]